MAQAAHKVVSRAVAPPGPTITTVASAATRGRAQLQSAVKVSSPTDPAEKEAAATAKKIMRMAVPAYSADAPPGTPAGRRAAWVSPHVARFADAIHIARSARGVYRKSEGQPDTGSNVSAELSASLASGSPLPAGVRRFMEPRFRADFGGVRIHTGDKAAQLNRQFSAQAFALGNQIFFGKDKFRPETDDGKELIAHELTHTIQQGAVVQRSEDVAVTNQTAPHVQRLGLSDALDYFADKANLIPGFRMFTIVLGVNPINMSRVERSAANIIRAIVEFIPGGALITQALDNHGVFDKVGNWVEQQIRTLGMTGAAIKSAIGEFLDSLGWRDIFHLGDVWTRAKRIFTEPIDRLIAFGKGLITGIIKFIKDAILRPLAKLAEGTRGYDLLKAILGEDPVTGDPVPRNAETLIGGFMKLIGQEEVWENLKKSNAVARAWAWFQGAMSAVLGFVREIPGLFVKAFQSLELADIILVPRAFAKIVGVFANFIGRFITWAGNAVWSLLEIIFAVVAPGAVPYLQKAAGAFRTILKNPIGFVGNLVRAGKQGFQQFASNILTHLKASLIGWLTGAMAGAAIYIPQSFEIREIIKFVLSVLGLTWANIRQKLVRAIGETAVKVLETGFDIVVTLVTQGPAAAWEKIKEQLTNLKEMVLDEIVNFVVTKVVQSAVIKLVSMLNPAGAFIQAIIAIYNTVMFFIERLKQIAQVAMAFIDSIAAIASGVIAAAASKVEQTLAGLLTLAISFLARLVGLGKVSDIVVNIVNKIRAPIDKALDKVVDWIVTMAKKVGKFLVASAKKLVEWWKVRRAFSADGEPHSVSFSGEKQAARLIVASNDPMPLPQFLAVKKTEFAGNAAKLAVVGQIEKLLPQLDTARNAPEDKYEQAQKDIEGVIATLIPLLTSLLSGTEIGTEANPLPLEYTKRRAGLYPIIYIGPKTAKRIDQTLLQGKKVNDINKALADDNERQMWAQRNNQIDTYLPTQLRTLPDGSGPIGIELPFQIDVGLRVEYSAGKTKGGGLINKTLEPYGYRAKDEANDGDHIVEMQIGGPNELKNLWPLPRGENRSSGSLLKNAINAAKGQLKPNQQKGVTKDHFFILITKTRTP